MPFINITAMDQRIEFILLSRNKKFKFNELCRRYKISRTTGYKWVNRYRAGGVKDLFVRSRRPINSPNKYNGDIEKYIVDLRKEEPEWGPKKLHRILYNQQAKGSYPFEIIPCRNTISKMLKRNYLIDPDRSIQSKAFKHFEYEEPNELWQMDFKGYFLMLNNKQCHPLAILDDHSRFNVGLYACNDEKNVTVKIHLIEVFEKYGMPCTILTDNGNPWGPTITETDAGFKTFSEIEKWLIRLNIRLIHGRPYHPQTQGKEERFNKTFKNEVLKRNNFKNTEHCQVYFDIWREKYNCIRPHESLNFDVPTSHYSPSKRTYPAQLPPVVYGDGDLIKKVAENGSIYFQKKHFKIGKGFKGEYVAIKQNDNDGEYDIYFCNQFIRNISLK
jgi:transposase InsO family protein